MIQSLCRNAHGRARNEIARSLQEQQVPIYLKGKNSFQTWQWCLVSSLNTSLSGGTVKKIFATIPCIAVLFCSIFTVQARAVCNPGIWDLTAGQTIKVGTVSMSNDALNLYVTYKLTYTGATFGTLHTWVGDDISLVPSNAQGIPVPGQFPWHVDVSGLTTATLAIPLSSLGITDMTKMCNTVLYVVAHAEVSMDSNNDGQMETETAFGGDIAGPGNRWWFYGYTVCCDFQMTLVKLKKFTAAPGARKVALKWTTASEYENAGFYLLRSEDGEDGYERVNPHMVPSKGTMVRGASYSFTDTGLQRNRTYYYKLEDVDTAGTSTFHGPLRVKTSR